MNYTWKRIYTLNIMIILEFKTFYMVLNNLKEKIRNDKKTQVSNIYHNFNLIH